MIFLTKRRPVWSGRCFTSSSNSAKRIARIVGVSGSRRSILRSVLSQVTVINYPDPHVEVLKEANSILAGSMYNTIHAHAAVIRTSATNSAALRTTIINNLNHCASHVWGILRQGQSDQTSRRQPVYANIAGKSSRAIFSPAAKLSQIFVVLCY